MRIFRFECRFFRKPRSRDRDPDVPRPYATMRYPSASRGDDYEYDDGGGDYDEVEEEQFHDMRKGRHAAAEYRRRIEHNRTVERIRYPNEKSSDRYDKYDSFESSSNRSSGRRERDFSYDGTPPTHPTVAPINKFDFETPDNGFESDFNATPEKNLRFSTDFSAVEKAASAATATTSALPSSARLGPTHSMSIQSGSAGTPSATPTSANIVELNSTPPQQKLRFDDKITVSKFDLFEDDDFSKAEFSFSQNEDQWIDELPKKNNLKNVTTAMKMRHENIKKSESVNIFARNNDDPFEDDDFFNKRSAEQNSNNFAKFDDNL